MSHKFGEGYFDLGDNTVNYDELVVIAGGQVLQNVQKYITLMVSQEDHDALYSFQECLRVIFQQASECITAGVRMEIEEDDDTEDLQ